MKNLFASISTALEQIQHGWTSEAQAFAMASSIVALRASMSVEIGVWAGKGLITMGLAHKALNHGMAIGIDPYSKAQSIKGQGDAAHAKWWGEVDHLEMLKTAKENIAKNGVEDWVRLATCPSDDFPPPEGIGVLRVDGNHGEQALRDVHRFAPNVMPGGILFLDDLNWAGGAVNAAAAWLRSNGWQGLYPLGSTLVFQKV